MEHVVQSVFLASPAPTPDVCAQGGAVVVAGFQKIVDIGKYLLGVSVFLGAAIWLATEFFREAQAGSFKVSSFVFNHQLPLLLLLLGVGLLLGFTASSLLGGAGPGKPPC